MSTWDAGLNSYFDTLPPHRRPVGDDVNLSDLVVKNDPALPEVRQ
jgi:hypothetical protein